MHFTLFGSLEVWDGGRAVEIGRGRRRSLLALLLLHTGEVVPAERLIDELWAERPPATANKGLQVLVSQLRRDLQPHPGVDGAVLITRANGYLLRVGREDLDIRRFEDEVASAERARLHEGPESTAERLRGALAMWRGPPLADFTYEPFAQPEIARLEELRLVALEQRVDADLALGGHARLVGELETLVRAHPLRERLRGQLMLALYRSERQAESLEVFRDGRRLMIDELGLEPGPALRELEAQILAHSAGLAQPAPPPDAGSTPDRETSADRPPAAPVTSTRRPPRIRLAALIAGAAVLVGGASLFALLHAAGNGPKVRAAAVDVAANSVVQLGERGRDFGVPLPGRPTDIAAARGAVFAVTVDSAALTIVDARTHAIVRTVPLSMAPAAVAVAQGDVWVADSRRGLVVRIPPGYERPSARIAYHREPATVSGDGRFGPHATTLATGAGAVWMTDGSARLLRIDPRTNGISSLSAGRPLDGVAVGAGAVWAFSTRAATVVRVDPRRGAVTDAVPIVSRRGDDAPSPAAIAVTPGGVWVLNRNTATVVRIDPEHRGVDTTIPVGVDRSPTGMAAAGETVLISNFDGSLSRLGPQSRVPTSRWVGDSLTAVAADGTTVWVSTTALDQRLPGGAG